MRTYLRFFALLSAFQSARSPREISIAVAIGLFSFSAFSFAQPPGNDTCPGYAITTLPYVYYGNTTNANTDYGLGCEAVLGVHEVIFRLSLLAQTQVTASLCSGTEFQAQINVYTYGPCYGSQAVACDEYACGTPPRGTVTFTTNALTTYYLVVAGSVNGPPPQWGAYRLAVWDNNNPPPTNDACPGTLISSLPFSDSGNTVLATNNYHVPDSWGWGVTDTNEVVYRLNLPNECTWVTVSLCGSSYNTLLWAYNSCSDASYYWYNNDTCGLQSEYSFRAWAGLDYYLFVDGDGETGAYTLNVTGTPYDRHGGCLDTLTSIPFADSGFTACGQAGTVNCWNLTSRYSVIYPIRLPQCYHVVADLCGSDYNSELFVKADDYGSCGGSPLVCNDDSPEHCGSNRSWGEFDAFAGETYFIMVGTNGSVPGFFRLFVTGTPLPSDSCPAYEIFSLPYTHTGTTACAADNYPDCVSPL